MSAEQLTTDQPVIEREQMPKDQLTECGAPSCGGDDHWDLVIRPKRVLLDVNLREVWEYRDLLVLFVRRDIVTVYKQTVLGPIWFFLQPILTTAVYVLVFGNIAKLSTDGQPKILFYMCGVVLWNYFSESFRHTASTFRQNAGIFGKVYFPRILVPLSKVSSGLIKFGIQLSLFLLIYLYLIVTGTQVRPTVWLTLVPLLVLLMAGMGLGFGIIFSSLTTKYRDLTFLIQFGVQLLMYGTPIIYPMSTIPEKYRIYIQLNPISHVVEAFKVAFLGAGQLSVGGMTYSISFTLVVLFLGIIIFNKTEQNFMDTV